MLKKLIAGLFAAAALNSAASAGDVSFAGGALPDRASVAQTGNFEGPDTITDVKTGKTRYFTGFIKKNLPDARWKSFKDVRAEIPNALDMRPKLSQIENQGNCGSCWAFGLTASHRDGHLLNGSDPGRLSQEWLVDNSTYAAGCKGGYFDSAYDFVKPKGQPLWKDCPYANGNGKCKRDLPIAAGIAAWYMLGEKDNAPSARDIQAYMITHNSPVAIAVAAKPGDWMSYSGGVYSSCVYGELDHMINIVGWDNEGEKFDANGNLPPGKGIWILRNSWGTYWGEKGYMRTKMTDQSGKPCNAVAEQAAGFDF